VVADEVRVIAVGDGAYRVEHDGRTDLVYVAEAGGVTWAFWNGHVFTSAGERGATSSRAAASSGSASAPRRGKRADSSAPITAPMPATVVKVLVAPGDAVKKGDTILVLEAMKMEMPIRATADGTVAAVHCREGELVQPDTLLVEFARANG
jgi:biotin carboxyl carrier protein